MDAPAPADAQLDAPQRPASLRELLTLAWPIMISRSTQSVVTICDALMISALGPAALGATSTGGFNTFLFMIFPMGVVFLVSSFAAQFFGQGDMAGARRYGWYGLGIAALTQLFMVAARPFIPEMLGAIDYAPNVRALMTGYMQLRILSVGASTGMEALSSYYGGIGNTRLPMLTALFAMTINVLLCWMFIGGHLGAPALGVRGAALGNAVATWLAFAVLLGCFIAGVGAPKVKGRVRLELGEFVRLLRFGLPSGFNWLFEFLAIAFFINVVVTSLGTDALAAMMSVFDLNTVAFMPSFGLASAGAILVGQQIGAGRKDSVPATVWLTLRSTMAWQFSVGALYIAFPHLILGFFVDGQHDTRQFVEIGRRTLVAAGLWQLVDATATTYGEALRAAGDTAFTLWARVALAWLVFVPSVYVAVRVLGKGDVAASVCFVGYICLLALVLVQRFNNGAWRRLDLTGASTHGH